MQQPSTYWRSQDGHIFSENSLIAGVISGLYDGKVVVLDDYNGRGGIVPFRHPVMKMIRYDAWTEKVILAIHRGDLTKVCLTELFCKYHCICLPDLDLLDGKPSTMELLAGAILDALPRTQIVIHGNQLAPLVPYLLELLGDNKVYFSICRDEL